MRVNLEEQLPRVLSISLNHLIDTAMNFKKASRIKLTLLLKAITTLALSFVIVATTSSYTEKSASDESMPPTDDQNDS